MKKLFVALILSILFVCSTVAGKKTDKEIVGLIGLVKEVRIEDAILSNKFGELVEGQRKLQSIESYDIKGNNIEKAWYKAGLLSENTVFTYNDKGNMIEKKKYIGDGSLYENTVCAPRSA